MGDLGWTRNHHFGLPARALQHHIVSLGTSGSGKSVTNLRIAYGGRSVYQLQVVYLDAKGETKRGSEEQEDSAARFVATMWAAGTRTVKVFPATYYNGWQGNPAELKNRLLSVIDFSESAYYGDVAANALDLALYAPTTPRNSRHFLANLRYDRLKAIYQHDREQYRRVVDLDKKLLEQVEMRYQVFFRAMAGQLDGTLDYADADAVYLRVRGFALRQEAPRLGRFLVQDFIHYISERRKPNVRTLLIIDEYNVLRMREETSVLFEQARSFGGCLVISSQGYAGLGPREYADRILDACSTYVLHACSDPFPVARRAGKHFRLSTSWTEDEEGTPRKHIRPEWVWRVPENGVMQQEEGQAYWIHRGHAQQVQTVQVPIADEQVKAAWGEIRRQEAQQRTLIEEEEQHRRTHQARTSSPVPNSSMQQQPPRSKRKPTRSEDTRTKGHPPLPPSAPPASEPKSGIASSSALPPLPPPPTPNVDDDEPDEL